MTYYFAISGRLDGMNDIIGMARNNKFGSAGQKKKQMQIVIDGAKKYGLSHIIIEKKVDVEFTFYEPNAMRDPDNISAAMKFIFDALVNMGVLPDDNQKHIGRIVLNEIRVDKGNPHIEVRLEERD